MLVPPPVRLHPAPPLGCSFECCSGYYWMCRIAQRRRMCALVAVCVPVCRCAGCSPCAPLRDCDAILEQTKGKRVGVIRDIIREICGLAPYEKRVLDILKGGGASSEKRAYKFAKRRVRAFDSVRGRGHASPRVRLRSMGHGPLSQPLLAHCCATPIVCMGDVVTTGRCCIAAPASQ